jgi:mannose-6-phosphate isomerase-like protein (cupin superfamily)
MSINPEKSKNLCPFIFPLPKDDFRYHKVLGLTQSKVMRSGLVCLQSGQDVGSHNTGKHEELLVILDGTGEVEIEGFGRQSIRKDCVAFIPPATQHNVFNIDSTPLRYLYIVSRTE